LNNYITVEDEALNIEISVNFVQLSVNTLIILMILEDYNVLRAVIKKVSYRSKAYSSLLKVKEMNFKLVSSPYNLE
jgi:hypothetical protein